MDEIILTVTTYELDVMVTGLGELPFKAVAGLIQKLVNQANSQRNGNGPERSSGNDAGASSQWGASSGRSAGAVGSDGPAEDDAGPNASTGGGTAYTNGIEKPAAAG